MGLLDPLTPYIKTAYLTGLFNDGINFHPKHMPWYFPLYCEVACNDSRLLACANWAVQEAVQRVKGEVA